MENEKFEKLNIDFEDIINSSAEGVITIDLNYNILSFNKEAERITGYTKEEALKSKCFEIFRANICESNCSMKKVIECQKNIINQNINLINKNGETLPLSITTGLLKDRSGKLIGSVKTFRDCSEVEALKKEIEKSYKFQDIIGKSGKIKEIIKILPDIAKSESHVLIQGPSGSGKEIFARAIHDLSNRNTGPFVAINCGAIPENLLESEMFGYIKGAFTDAKTDKLGKFAIARGGTIFFDEIGDMPTQLQVKLLRVIQEKEYEPIGSNKLRKTNVRLILATNKNLFELVKKKMFRNDLYFRINVIKLDLPSLKERREDIPLLISHFIKLQNFLTGKNIRNISEEVLTFLMNYDYPGNIRELQNIIEYAFILCHDRTIDMQHLPKEIVKNYQTSFNSFNEKEQKKEDISFADAETKIIIKTLEKNKWKKGKTAKELDIHISTLWRKMKKYGISG